jgi:hypothetical protein
MTTSSTPATGIIRAPSRLMWGWEDRRDAHLVLIERWQTPLCGHQWQDPGGVLLTDLVGCYIQATCQACINVATEMAQ